MKKVLSVLGIVVLSLVLVACGGTKDAGIKAYTRDTTSGTRGAFFDIIGLSDFGGSNEGLVEGYVQVESNGAMMSSVKNDVNGIGYISLSSLDGSGLKGVSFNGVEATEANVLNDTYALKRPFMYVRKAEANLTNEDEKAFVNAFLAFMTTKEGKQVIMNADGIAEGLNTAPSWDSVKADHPIVDITGADVEIHFGGSTSVEKVGRALSEAFSSFSPRFKPIHNHTGSGAGYTGTRADGPLHIGFASRELKESEKVTGEYGRLAWDAVVVVVNNENEVTNLTTKQIQDIYNGAVTKWSEILN